MIKNYVFLKQTAISFIFLTLTVKYERRKWENLNIAVTHGSSTKSYAINTQRLSYNTISKMYTNSVYRQYTEFK